jgi:hypothetical protein
MLADRIATESEIALRDFAKVSTLTECDITKIKIDLAPKPHKRSGLPKERMAVYCFFLSGKALKIGIAGPNSDARFRSQHYNPNSVGSNLAKSILTRPERMGIPLPSLSPDTVGGWIMTYTDRLNFLLPASYGKPTLSQLEVFLHARWKPIYEGRAD